MKDALTPLQAAIVTRLVARMTTAGYTSASSRVVVNPSESTPMPYAIVGTDTAVPWDTKTGEGAECTHLIVVWGETLTATKTLAGQIVEWLTNRTDPITVTGYKVVMYRLEMVSSPIEDEQPSGTYYGIPLRFRYKLQEV